MNEEQVHRIAAMLHRVSDRAERDEVTREIAKVLEEARISFDRKKFFHTASVEEPPTSS
jgi:hypothetical protein